MARAVPKGANRGPRDKKVTIYLSDEEIEALDKYAKNLGFRSKTTLIVYMLEGPIQDGLSGLSFGKLGRLMTNLISKSPNSTVGWDQLNPFKKRKSQPKPEDYE